MLHQKVVRLEKDLISLLVHAKPVLPLQEAVVQELSSISLLVHAKPVLPLQEAVQQIIFGTNNNVLA